MDAIKFKIGTEFDRTEHRIRYVEGNIFLSFMPNLARKSCYIIIFKCFFIHITYSFTIISFIC